MSKQKQRQKQLPKQHGQRQRPRSQPRPQQSRGTPPWLPAGAAILIVGIAIAIFIFTRPGTNPPRPSPSASVAAGLVRQLGAIPLGELDQVGAGTSNSSRFKHISEPPLTSGGKPALLYIGAEYCPYCAGERWALIVALSRFGTFSGVSAITSSEGGYSTFSFHGAQYSSQYLAFVPREALDQNHNQLDPLTAQESSLEQKYATGIPFVDFGNHTVFDGATYDVTALQGQSWQQVVSALQTPQSAQAQGVLGSANLLTAAICQLTGQQPADVCGDPVLQTIARQLPS